MEKTVFLVSVFLLIGANVLATYALIRIRRDFVATLSHTVRDLVTEWNKVSKTVSILTHGMDSEEKPLTGDLSASKSEDEDEKGMSASKRALYEKAGGIRR